jgi:hypothetical protein
MLDLAAQLPLCRESRTTPTISYVWRLIGVRRRDVHADWVAILEEALGKRLVDDASPIVRPRARLR